MPDVLGWRAKFGVLAPSTNTIVEPDFYRMSVPGVTAQLDVEHLMTAVKRLSPAELRECMQQLAAW